MDDNPGASESLEVMTMTVQERIQMIRILDLITKQPETARKIGVSGHMKICSTATKNGRTEEYAKNFYGLGNAANPR